MMMIVVGMVRLIMGRLVRHLVKVVGHVGHRFVWHSEGR